MVAARTFWVVGGFVCFFAFVPPLFFPHPVVVLQLDVFGVHVAVQAVPLTVRAGVASVEQLRLLRALCWVCLQVALLRYFLPTLIDLKGHVLYGRRATELTPMGHFFAVTLLCFFLIEFALHL